MSESIRYDVAISFLSSDEPMARALEEKLNPMLRVFIFSKKQEEIAGTDGLEAFREAFRSQSRLNIVLFRNGWGGTKWTRVEETAIKDRCLNDGWKTLMFVMLERKAIPPIWLPDTHVRFNLDEFGFEQCVGAIKMRVKELGGKFRLETIEEQASRIHKSSLRAEEMRRFLESQSAVEIASKEAFHVCEILEATAATVTEKVPELKFTVRKTGNSWLDLLEVSSFGFSITIHWYFKARNWLGEDCLSVVFKEVERDHFKAINGAAPNRIQVIRYEFAVDESNQYGWREQFGKRDFLPSSRVADESLRRLLEMIGDYRTKEATAPR